MATTRATMKTASTMMGRARFIARTLPESGPPRRTPRSRTPDAAGRPELRRSDPRSPPRSGGPCGGTAISRRGARGCARQGPADARHGGDLLEVAPLRRGWSRRPEAGLACGPGRSPPGHRAPSGSPPGAHLAVVRDGEAVGFVTQALQQVQGAGRGGSTIGSCWPAGRAPRAPWPGRQGRSCRPSSSRTSRAALPGPCRHR